MSERAERYARARECGALIDLSARARWELTGADQVRFLNGQVSNDMRRLGDGRAVHACVLTAKGKLCGDIFVSATADSLRLDAARELRESLAARLERYIISDDVALTDVTDSVCAFHVLIGSAKLLPPELEGVTKVSATRFFHPGFDLLAPVADREKISAALGETFVRLDEELAEVFRIEAGVPRWSAELNEDTLPNEAGLDQDAIDYHKGCYLGQEVISRIKSVGHVNRQLTGFVASEPLAAGMEVFAGGEKPAGKLTSAAWSFGLERFAGLGYLKRGVASEALAARAADGSTRAVAARELPLIP